MSATLTDDEAAVLMIANEGESMISIGRWEKPIDSLVARGLMIRHNKANAFITDAGRVAIKEREQEDDRALLEMSRQAGNTSHEARSSCDHAAQAVVRAVRATQLMRPGGPIETTLSDVLVEVRMKALELLRA